MSGHDQAVLVLALAGFVVAAAGLFFLSDLHKAEREIAERKSAEHPAE